MNFIPKGKKGLSDVITTVLIILLVLAAVVLIWGFIQNQLKSTTATIDINSKCLTDVNVVVTSCVKTNDGATISYNYAGTAPKNVTLIATAETGETALVTINTPSLVGSSSVSFAAANSQVAKSAYAIAIIDDGKGEEYSCPVKGLPVDCTTTA